MSEFADCPVDLRYLAENQPSLCIPRVFKNISEEFIRKTFDKLALGKIQRIDLIERRTERGEIYNRAFIHFEKWFWNQEAQDARKRLIIGKDIKIVYDNPWFWKVSANKWSPRTSEYRGTQLPNVGRPHTPTQPHTTPTIAPTLDVGETRPPAHPQSHSEKRKIRNQHRPNNQRFPEVNRTPVTPPPSRAHTPPQAPQIRRRPSFHEEYNTEVCEDELREEQASSNQFNVTDVRNIDYGNVAYPPPRKILKRQTIPSKLDFGEDTQDEKVDSLVKNFDAMKCNENEK